MYNDFDLDSLDIEAELSAAQSRFAEDNKPFVSALSSEWDEEMYEEGAEERLKAFEEGAEAFERGMGIALNPYNDFERHDMWDDGYKSRQDDSVF